MEFSKNGAAGFSFPLKLVGRRDAGVRRGERSSFPHPLDSREATAQKHRKPVVSGKSIRRCLVYWDTELETLNPAAPEELQLERLRQTLAPEGEAPTDRK
jgi:hypothetical protein